MGGRWVDGWAEGEDKGGVGFEFARRMREKVRGSKGLSSLKKKAKICVIYIPEKK
jgi:hypothetical protein